MTEQTSNENLTLAIDLSVAEINIILRSLSKHPFDEINSLINNIKTQGDAKLALVVQSQDPSTN